MAPQFVDFNADGHIDLVTATFDGSPHVALGSAEGFGQPERVLDANGDRLLLDQFWNYETAEWDEADRLEGGGEDGEHCISAVAFDWDGDEDLDLILGAYKTSQLYVQINEGTSATPEFSGVNQPIPIGGTPNALAGYMTAPQPVDWDGDGDLDLLMGTFGDCWQRGVGGGVYLSLNAGEVGAPDFRTPIPLISPELKAGGPAPTRPDAGLYAQACDYDGDGDLDLLVGAYSMWDPVAPELTPEEVARAAELEARIETLQDQRQVLLDGAFKDAEDIQAAYEALRETEAFQEVDGALQEATKELQPLRPPEGRDTAVWLYERLDSAQTTEAALGTAAAAGRAPSDTEQP